MISVNKYQLIKVLAISFFLLLRIYWELAQYVIGTDLAFQLKYSQNLVNGESLLDANYMFAPGSTFLVYFLSFLTNGDLILVDLFCRIILILFEAFILSQFINILFNSPKDKILCYLVLIFYTGHIYMTPWNDHIVTILFLYILFYVYKYQNENEIKYMLYISLLLPIIALFKYSAIVIVFAPITFYILNKIIAKKDLPKGILILFSSSILSLIIFWYFSIHLASMNGNITSFKIDNLFLLTRIDNFWWKLGPIDVLYKNIMWNIEEHFGIFFSFRHIAQIISLLFLIFFLWVMKLKKINIKAQSPLIIFLIISVSLMFCYLGGLTVFTKPQVGGYGIYGGIWVPIENSRYWAFAAMGFYLIIAYFLVKSRSYLIHLIILINISSYIKGTFQNGKFRYNTYHQFYISTKNSDNYINNEPITNEKRKILFILNKIDSQQSTNQ